MSKVHSLTGVYEKTFIEYVNSLNESQVSTTSKRLDRAVSCEWYYLSLQFSILILFTNNNLVPQLFLTRLLAVLFNLIL